MKRVPPPHTGGRFPRKTILDAIRKDPGLGVRDLAKRTGHSGITVSKHLAKLRANGKVVAVKDDKSKLHHFLAGQQKALEPDLNDLDHEILGILSDIPWTFPGLAQQLPEVPRSTLQYRVNRLVDLGFLGKDDITYPAMLNVIRLPKSKSDGSRLSEG